MKGMVNGRRVEIGRAAGGVYGTYIQRMEMRESCVAYSVESEQRDFHTDLVHPGAMVIRWTRPFGETKLCE